mmetsp:Transcript_11573/g.26791  ORF Transcript_11573/g.26791 Transcript_11573/m.26791 type:complete len:95 (-) Transcript_11573:603-887(-)
MLQLLAICAQTVLSDHVLGESRAHTTIQQTNPKTTAKEISIKEREKEIKNNYLKPTVLFQTMTKPNPVWEPTVPFPVSGRKCARLFQDSLGCCP